MDRKIRGSVINGYLGYVKKKWGKEGLDKCLRDIGLEGETIKEGHYYQDEISGNILRWIHREKGAEAVVDSGRFVTQNLGILAWLVRFTTMQSLAEKLPKNFSEVYAFGRCSVDTSDPKRIVLKLKDTGYYEEACLAWQGVCEAALIMTKTKGRVEHTRCEQKGDNICEFVIHLE